MVKDKLVEIKFGNTVSSTPLDNSHLLRHLIFQDYTPGREKLDVATELFLPGLDGFNQELWYSESPTSIESLSSPSDQIDILRVSSNDYDYLRFSAYEHPDSEKDLEDLTYLAYESLFSFIHDRSVAQNIIRMWNFIPCILDHQGDSINDSERYRQFNSGRRRAWHDHSGLAVAGRGYYRVPAATGIGTAGGPLVVEALLSADKTVDIQNPRQINAFEYSQKYGTHPPMFSRATLQLRDDGSAALFISGTASIVNEDTVHEADPIEQTHETFRNLSALISEANLAKYWSANFKPIQLADLQGVRVHIKKSEHLNVIKQVVQQYMGQSPVCYVEDDICRDGLLVEIESNGTLIEPM